MRWSPWPVHADGRQLLMLASASCGYPSRHPRRNTPLLCSSSLSAQVGAGSLRRPPVKAHTLREVKQPNATSRCVSGAMEERGDRAKRVRLSKRRKSRASAAKAAVPKGFQRVHPLLSPGNAWTWRFLPGLALGFALRAWLGWMDPGRRRKPSAAAAPSAAAMGSNGAEEEEEEEDEEEEYPGGEELKMVLCVNEDLKMGKGKIAAQCAHAAVGVLMDLVEEGQDRLIRRYNSCGQPKVALKAQDLPQLMSLESQARSLRLPTYMVADAGRTQIAAGSRTVLAIGPGPKSVIDQVTGHLKLL